MACVDNQCRCYTGGMPSHDDDKNAKSHDKSTKKNNKSEDKSKDKNNPDPNAEDARSVLALTSLA